MASDVHALALVQRDGRGLCVMPFDGIDQTPDALVSAMSRWMALTAQRAIAA
ncbi:hypothetical protein FHT09_003306 [Xanthomonas arboricola]|uniref:hypothetical protein n=1 Tax=Xanthomonas TaxID=338 RepID=UPI0015E46C51|nr:MULTISPECIES: hypothetical protein [Xanthomonas]MBB5737521.1 hypothetical protein [Xanthomonas sp. CFBP 8152]